MDVSTGWRVVKQFKDYGSVDKRHYSRDTSVQKLISSLELHVLNVVLMNPRIYLRNSRGYL